MTLTKAELAQCLVDEVGRNQREGKEMVETFFTEIFEALINDEEVNLANIGVFHSRAKPARPGRNPKTRVEVNITSRRVATFQPSATLKDGLDANLNCEANEARQRVAWRGRLSVE